MTSPLDGTVKIGGKAFEKKYVVLGLAGTGAVAYYVVQRRKATAAATAATDAGNTTADLGTDPATGYPYGSAEDAQALSDWQTTGLPTTGFVGGGGGSIGSTGGYTSNAEWTQAAETMLGSTGADAIAAALGHYVTGQSVTSDQRTSVEEAIAVAGYPPVPGANGYPPGIKDAAPTPGTPGGGTGSGSGGNHNRKKKVVVANGHMTLREMAEKDSRDTSYAQARMLNPWAHRFTVKTKNIPKGYKVTLYA